MLKIINKKKIHEVDSNTIAIITTIIILLGCFIFSYNYVKSKKVMAYSYINNIFYTEEEQQTSTQVENNEEVVEEQPQQQQINYNYIGYLEIPKIGLKKGFVSKDSKQNNVDRNIYVVKEADYPDKENGNLIIAGHSGTAWNSFFNDLYKLQVGDEIKVIYNNQTYSYKIADIYEQEKTGTVKIYRNYNKTTLTLVTCTNNSDTKQTIYIAYQN